MKIAGFVNPLVNARGPCFSHVWVEALAKLLQSLQHDARCDCLLISGTWFEEWARRAARTEALTGLHTVWLDELELYRRVRTVGLLPTALDMAAYCADDADHPALHAVAEIVAQETGGFEPDIIIGFAGQANYLAKLWPRALRLHLERGHFGRDPYPFSMYFDHLGTLGRSAIAQVGGVNLRYHVTPEGRALVSAFRRRMAAALEARDPFQSHDFRQRFDRLCLLPLQLSNELSFDGQVEYRTQFEFLYDVLAAAPSDVAVIATEHPNGEPVLTRTGICANLGTLRQRFPNLIVLDEFRGHLAPSQFLVPRVDGVWSVSSSVGYQALLFDGVLGAPAKTELAHVADATSFAEFFARLGQRRSTSTEAFVAWLLERYLVPATLFSDGPWLRDYLQRRLDAARTATDPIDAFVPIADADRLFDAWIRSTPGPVAMATAQWENDPLRAEFAAAVRALACERDALLSSTSWRITAPLRAAKNMMINLAGQRP